MNTTTATLPAKTQHKFFSPGRIFAIASNTLLELVRLKVFYFLMIFGVLVISLFGFTTMFDFPFQEQFQLLKDVSLGAMSIFTILLAMLATANMLPKDVEDRTLYTILAKPVPRFEYLLGKLLGMYLLILISTLVMGIMFAVALYAKQEFVIRETIQQYSGHRAAELPAQLADLKAHTFTVSLLPCIAIIYIKSVLLATLTMMISTFSSSYIFTLFLSFTCYFIGSIVGPAREYIVQYSVGHLMGMFTGIVALVFPDLQLFNLVDDIVAGNTISMVLFLKTAGLGCSYIFVYGLVAYVIFSFKEL